MSPPDRKKRPRESAAPKGSVTLCFAVRGPVPGRGL